MGELKHTRGPLYYEHHKFGRVSDFTIRRAHDDTPVASTFSDTQEDEANARLYVAAPVTLQTCLDVLSDCLILRDMNGITRMHAEFITAHLIEPLQATIRSAKDAPPQTAAAGGES